MYLVGIYHVYDLSAVKNHHSCIGANTNSQMFIHKPSEAEEIFTNKLKDAKKRGFDNRI